MTQSPDHLTPGDSITQRWRPSTPRARARHMTTLEYILSLDPFNGFRWLLSIVVTIYASIITAQSLWGWYVWLIGDDRYMSLLRRYLVVHGLRLRFKAFWGDVIVCGLLSVVFLLLWRAHAHIDAIGVAMEGAPRVR